MQKGQNPKYLQPLISRILDPQFFLHYRWKIKICDKISVWLGNRFSKWYVMTPLHQNTQTSLGPWEWAFSRPGTWRRSPWSQLTYPTVWLFCWANPENFSLFHAADQKLFHFYCQTHRQTDRRTFCIPICTGEIFSIWKFIPFTTLRSFMRFAHSLTHFICEGLLKVSCAMIWFKACKVYTQGQIVAVARHQIVWMQKTSSNLTNSAAAKWTDLTVSAVKNIRMREFEPLNADIISSIRN